MFHKAYFMLLIFPVIVESRDALQYFVHNKKLKSLRIKILNKDINVTKYWLEYKYKFQTNENNDKSSLKELKVGIIVQQNFDCKQISNNSTILSGYSIDIINWLKTNLNLSVKYVVFNNTKNIISSILLNKIDIMACHVNLAKDIFAVKQLYPTIKSKHILVYKPSKLHFTKDIFVLTFAGSLWLVFLVILIVLAISLKFSTSKYAMMNPKYEEWTWVEITLWAIAAACQQGLSNTPSGFSSCLIFLIGYLMSYLLYTGFAAAITSVLLQHDAYFKLDITNIKPEKLTLICYDESREIITSLYNNFVNYKYTNSFSEIFSYLNKDNVVAIVPELLWNEFIAGNSKISQYFSSRIHTLNYARGFLIKRNSSLAESINIQLLRMEESGILSNTLRRNLKSVPVVDLNYGYSSASSEHIQSAIWVLLAGILTAIIFLAVECLFTLYKKSRKT